MTKALVPHAIFTLIIEKSSIQDDKDFVCPKISFVDLAGSERLGRTQAIGKSMKEGININKGLLALGKRHQCPHRRLR